MGAETEIAWTDSTFNGWIGCTRYGEGCRNCYAEAQNRHWKWNGGDWGPGAVRKVTSPNKWREPLKWNREAEAAGIRRKVFAFSLGDWADAEGPEGALPWLWALWRATPWLDWQMLTKRAERIKDCLPPDWGAGYPNVWLGYSVACQTDADRGMPHMLNVPAAVRFLSCEPLIEPVDLSPWFVGAPWNCSGCSGSMRPFAPACERCGRSGYPAPDLQWIIVGGESGTSARPFSLRWARSIVEQCAAAGVACFFKQAGAHPLDEPRLNGARIGGDLERLVLKNKKGGNLAELPGGTEAWPREFPPSPAEEQRSESP